MNAKFNPDENGVLLGSIPVPRQDNLQIVGNRIYFFDNQEEMAVYEYKIIDLEK